MAKLNLEGVIKNEIKVMMETKRVKDQIEWVWADGDAPKQNHFVFAIAIDGFPRTKTKGSTEILLQTLNLKGGINQLDWNRIVCLADLEETSTEMDKVIVNLNKEISALQAKSDRGDFTVDLILPVEEEKGGEEKEGEEARVRFMTKTTKFTFQFAFKADLKYAAHVLGALGASAVNFGLFFIVTKHTAANLDGDTGIVLITKDQRAAW